MIEKPTTRDEQIEYLTQHPRYYGQYSRCIKIARIEGLTRQDRNACFDLLAIEESWDVSGMLFVIEDFEREHPGYVIGSEGRSSGYLVLFQKINHRIFNESDHERDWSLETDQEIQQKIDLVWAFDQACQDAVDTFVQFAREHYVREETIMVPKKIFVAVPRDPEAEEP